jgi:hypothetical protein
MAIGQNWGGFMGDFLLVEFGLTLTGVVTS